MLAFFLPRTVTIFATTLAATAALLPLIPVTAKQSHCLASVQVSGVHESHLRSGSAPVPALATSTRFCDRDNPPPASPAPFRPHAPGTMPGSPAATAAARAAARSRVKVLFVPHGGGPMPILGDPGHKELVKDLTSMRKHFTQNVKCAIIVTAHWEGSEAVQITGQAQPDLLFDYYGFPAETYKYKYPAPGSPELAKQLQESLSSAGIAATIDTERGYDHGTFIPMMLLAPDAKIPILQVSLLASLDPKKHLELGHALGSFVEALALADAGHGDSEAASEAESEGDATSPETSTLLPEYLIVGSGLSFHNLGTMRSNPTEVRQKSEVFDEWLSTAIMGEGTLPQTSKQEDAGEETTQEGDQHTSQQAETERALANWEKEAPQARYAHPREEHLLPLFVCVGAGGVLEMQPQQFSRNLLMNCRNSGFLWQQ